MAQCSTAPAAARAKLNQGQARLAPRAFRRAGADQMGRCACVAGVGMVPFNTPGTGPDYVRMGQTALRLAIQDAGIDYCDARQVYAGNVHCGNCAGQRVAYEVGLTGIPIVNVNNYCATGATALYLARQAIAGGDVDCVIALGFDSPAPGGALTCHSDQPDPFDRFESAAMAATNDVDLPLVLRCCGGAGRDHMRAHGSTLADFAAIRAKSSRHASRNPMAVFRQEISTEDVLAAPVLWEGVMTSAMAGTTSSGAAAVVLCNTEFAMRRGLNRLVRIRAQAMTSDKAGSFETGDMRDLVGAALTRRAAQHVYAAAGLGPEDVDVIELHDCCVHNEMISYEALGLCPRGEGPRLSADGDNTYGGRYVVNPSGGLLSLGHPPGATGLAQCVEIVQQLRGHAGQRQVHGARIGLQQNLSQGSTCVITMYEAS